MSGKGKGKNLDKKEEKEIDCSCYVRQRDPDVCPPIRNVTHPLRYYEFTQEEMKALEECDRESFYQRCLPFSAMGAASTYAAVKYRFLNASPHWGSTPKVTLAALLGHFIGRVSSMPSCARKLREDLPPDSHLGSVMRKYWNEAHPPPDPKK